MNTFMNIHQKDIIGNLTMFDRVIFKGYLTSFFPKGAFEIFLNRQNILLKNYNKYVQKATNLLKTRAEQLASQNNKEIIHIKSAKDIKSKGKKAREIAEKENIKEGLICILNQSEIATDIMFKDRLSLKKKMPDLFGYSITVFSANDVMKFLGRKLYGQFRGEVTTDYKKRPEGYRVKHRMKSNHIKMYDKYSVLRIETTINNSREFKILITDETKKGEKKRLWKYMNKGVANMWRYYQVAKSANYRYLEALSYVKFKGEVSKELGNLCRSIRRNGKRYSKFNPHTKKDYSLFKAVINGDHMINGFRNRDICSRIYGDKKVSCDETRRRCARISRSIAKLRGHGLIKKVRNSYLYRVTKKGYRIFGAIIFFHEKEFAWSYLNAA